MVLSICDSNGDLIDFPSSLILSSGFSNGSAGGKTVKVLGRSNSFWVLNNSNNTYQVYIVTADNYTLYSDENIITENIDWMIYQKGSESMKPTLTSDDGGFEYYNDTNHRMKYWNSSAWVELTGTSV